MSACPTPGKVQHPTARDAWRHATDLRRKGASVDLKPYRCACGSFHVGHSQVSLIRRIRRARREGTA